MSIKHIREEYNRIVLDYLEMLDTVHELEEAVSNSVVSQEKLDEVKQSVEIVKANYMRWNWVMHLLDLPNKPQKQKKFNKQFKQRIDDNKKITSEHEENLEAIANFKNKINSLK